jgi:hypothetical protein
MSKNNIGGLIYTATKNITGGQPLTEDERAVVSTLAISMKALQRNWQPIFVRETGLHQFQLIGNAIILEAAKLAGLEVVYCIQIDDSDQIEQEIINTQQLTTRRGDTSIAGVDLSPLLKRIDTMESAVNEHSELLGDVLNYLKRLMPEETIAINKENKELLRAKLEGRISRIGSGKIKDFIDEIIKNRPFYTDDDLRYKIGIFKPKKSKSSSPVHEVAWKSFVENFNIDYSI